MKLETIVLDEQKNTSLTCFIQDTEGEFIFKERPAILIIPGGAYTMCSDREADPIAFAFLNRGYQAFILRYSLDQTWPNPLNDYEKAMEIIKSRPDFHVAEHKIAVCGFSAGGHLTASAATMAKNRPDAAIIVYGVLLGDITDSMHVTDCPYPVDFVDDKTCPCFLCCARDDNMVPSENTLRFCLELDKRKINYETRVYAFGGHGYSTGLPYIAGDNCAAAVKNWMEDSLNFCDYIFGRLTQTGFEEPKLRRCVVDDYEETLSLNCSMGLFKEKRNRFESLLPEVYEALDKLYERFGTFLDFIPFLNMPLNQALNFLQTPEEKKAELKQKLAGIKNN